MARVSVSGGQVRTPVGDAPVIPLVVLGTGMYLAWFGIHYWRSDTKWPTDPVKAVLQGKPVPGQSTATPLSAELTSDIQAYSGSGSGGSGSSGSGTPSGVSQQGESATGSASSEQNKSIAQAILPSYGWASQFTALDNLWTRESGWNAEARNTSSGAFGIAQALGHGEGSATAAPDGTNEYGGYGLSASEASSANAGHPYWQIIWGLNYIKSTYGNPDSAWAHEQDQGWY